MVILLFHSISGLPKNNFDPLVGDTFKPLYYSFVLIFSFTILVAILLSEKYKRFFYLGIYCLLIIFIIGFPKSSEFEVSQDMAEKIEISIFCPVEKYIYFDNQNPDFFDCNTDEYSRH